MGRRDEQIGHPIGGAAELWKTFFGFPIREIGNRIVSPDADATPVDIHERLGRKQGGHGDKSHDGQGGLLKEGVHEMISVDTGARS